MLKWQHRERFSLESKQWQSVFVSPIQPPTGFSPKARSGRDLSCHSSYGSLPRDVRDQTPPRTEGSPIRGYASIEVTNVWGQTSRHKHRDISLRWNNVVDARLSCVPWHKTCSRCCCWRWTFSRQLALLKMGQDSLYKFPGVRETF